MQKVKMISIAVLLVYTLTVTAMGRDMFAVKTSLSTTPSNAASYTISMAAGEILEFSARDLERRLSLDEGALGGITVTGLPSASQGTLVLDGVDVEAYEFLDRESLNRLCFVAAETASGAVITFLPQTRDAVTTSLAIQVLASPNSPPEIQDTNSDTVVNVAKTGTIAASDPDGGSVTLKLVKKPQKGTVSFSGLTYTYQPFKDMSGADSFAVCAVDELSAYSREATVSVRIEQAKKGFFYLDMQDNPSNYAALKLRDAGILVGEKIGSAYLFQPDRIVDRGEFIVMLLAAAKLENTVTPTINTGLPNDTKIPGWLKPYVKAAVDAKIIAKDQPFVHYEVPIRAEAVLMCANAAKITDVKDFDLTMPDVGAIPDWAQHAYQKLAAYRMLDLHYENAIPYGALTHSYSADLLWQLYKHANR